MFKKMTPGIITQHFFPHPFERETFLAECKAWQQNKFPPTQPNLSWTWTVQAEFKSTLQTEPVWNTTELIRNGK